MLYKVDEFCVELAKGAKPDVWGLVIVILWPAPQSFKEQYERFCAKVKEIDGNDAIYMYPFEALHSTVMTISPFLPDVCSLALSSDPNVEAERQAQRAKWNEAWVEALSSVFDRVDDKAVMDPGAKAACRLTYKEPTMSPAAGFMHIGNPTGEIDKARKLVQDKLMGSEMHAALREAGYCRSDFKIPNIRHATIFRYVKDPAPDFEARFQALAQEWEEHAVEFSPGEEGPRLCLVEEIKPYMHVSRSNCLATYCLPSGA